MCIVIPATRAGIWRDEKGRKIKYNKACTPPPPSILLKHMKELVIVLCSHVYDANIFSKSYDLIDMGD